MAVQTRMNLVGLGITLLMLMTGCVGATRPPLPPPELRALFVGNSLTLTNNLPALLRELLRRRTPAVELHADLLVTGGGSLAERWHEGVAAELLKARRYDVLVLQERGGVIACMAEPATRDAPDCRASIDAHRAFARLARAQGTRLVLLGTWNKDDARRRKASHALHALSDELSATPVDAGAAFCRAALLPDTPGLIGDEQMHPTLPGSLLTALLLEHTLLGDVFVPADFDATLALYSPTSYFTAQAVVAEQFDPTPPQPVHMAKEMLARLSLAVPADGNDACLR